MSSDNGIEPGFVDDLLSLPTRGEQETFLRDADLLDADGLKSLLDVADRLVVGDPGRARQLAELCCSLAELAGAFAAIPHANYVVAGVHSMNGEFEEDLKLTEHAYNEYVGLGMNLEALRTKVGKMAALLELGRYDDALYAGQEVLDTLDGNGELQVSPTLREADLLGALVQQNRGGCLEYMGRYDEALDAYAAAEDKYRSLNDAERLGEITSNRGAVLLQLGRGGEALAAQEAAANVFKEAGLTLRYAQALANVGESYLHLGNYRHSLNSFEHARRLLDSLDAAADKNLLTRDMANVYLALNLYSESLTNYRGVVNPLRSAGMIHDRAQVLWGMGSALIARSELAEAERVLDEAAALFSESGNVPLLSGVMVERASLLESLGDRVGALDAARQALDLVSEQGWPVQQVYARLRLADLLLPDVDAAEPHLLAAQQLADRLALPQLRYRLNERLGRLRRLQGRDEEARTLLEAAVEEVERLRGTVAQNTMRASFLRDKTAAYEDLLRLYLSREDEEGPRHAFAVAEKAKSRALVDLLTGVARGPVQLADPELEERMRALQGDLNAVYSELLGEHGEDGYEVPLSNLRKRATELEAEVSYLQLQAASVGSTLDPFATPMSSGEVLKSLPPDTILLAYHVVEDEILAFVCSDGRLQVARNLGSAVKVRRLLQKLSVQLDRFRADRGFIERHKTLLERSARQILTALYAQLVAPLQPLPEKAQEPDKTDTVQKLAVVPHGVLHQVPFHALFDGEHYLLERFEVSFAPSATVYALCQRQEARGLDEARVFGVEDPSIPAAVKEAREVADRIQAAVLRIGKEATVAALRAEASGCSVLHLACHGLFRVDNPMFSALKLHDGWLLAADAIGLDLNGALVALSACETGRSEVIGGDEILGLARAFLGAGAATLVVSQWLVQDETTAELMSSWYERLRGGERPATALRAAQLEIMQRYPHPYYWAPFVLIGKR